MPLDSPILCFIQGHFLLKRRQSQGLQFQDLLPLASYKMGNQELKKYFPENKRRRVK